MVNADWARGSLNSLEGAGGIGGLLAVSDPNDPNDLNDAFGDFVYFYDGNGNVGQVVDLAHDANDPAGAIVAKYEYDPYGQRIHHDGSVPEYDQPWRFSTKQFDAETGLGYWGYRYYSPGLGRWISRDPIGEPGFAPGLSSPFGLTAASGDSVEAENALSFVRNSPGDSVDSFGLHAQKASADAGCCAREDILTDYHVCCGKIENYGPFAELLGTHCELRKGSCSENEKSSSVWLDGSCSRKMDGGPACGCATTDDIAKCLKRNPYPPNNTPLPGPYGIGNNCQTATIMQLGKCCLKSNWEPHFYAGDPRRMCVSGHWEAVGGGNAPERETNKWVCDKWLELPEWRKVWGCARGHWDRRLVFDGTGKSWESVWVCDQWGWIDKK